MKYKALLCVLVVCTIGAQADILTPIMAISVTDDGSATSVGSVNVAGTALDGSDYVIRERRSTGQSDRQINSFFQFDVSSYTLADIQDPGFTAIFTIEYDAQLNDIVDNNSAPAVLGRVASGDGWNLSGTDYPLYNWGFDEAGGTNEAQNIKTLIANIPALTPTGQEVSVDVTDIVTGWVDGSYDNNGFVLFIDELEAQGAGFSNPELIVTIPEPSTLGLVVVMGSGILYIRRRFLI
jgi:hypothetical protein